MPCHHHQRNKRRLPWVVICFCAGAAVVSCASTNRSTPSGTNSASGTEQPAELPYDPARAFLRLADIHPPPEFPTAPDTPQETSVRARQQIEKAEQLFEEDRYTEAIQRLERALRYSPTSLPAHRLMSVICLQAGNSARAKEHLMKALEFAPRDAQLHYLLGRAFGLQNAWRESLQELRLVRMCPNLEDYPDIAVVLHYYLGESLRRLEYARAAIGEYERFILGVQDWPQEANNSRLKQEAHNLLLPAAIKQSELYVGLGDPLKAAQGLARVVNDSPQHVKRIAELYAQAGEYERAAQTARRLADRNLDEGLPLLISVRRQSPQAARLLTDLKEMLALHPHDYRLVNALAEEHLRNDDAEAAVELLREFVANHADHPQAGAELAGLLLVQQRPLESLDVLAEVMDSIPDPQRTVSHWLERIRETGQLQNTFNQIKRLIDQDATGPMHLYILGLFAGKTGQLELAEHALRKSHQGAPHSLDITLALADVLLDSYRWQEAIDILNQHPDADDYRAYRLLGEAYLGLDDYDNAEDALNQASRLNRTDLRVMSTLARVYEMSDKPLQAQRQYQIILERDPGNVEALEALFASALNDKKADLAEQYLKMLEEADAASPARRLRALLQLAQDGNVDRYAAALESINADHPDDAATLMQLAHFAINQRQFDRALERLEEILNDDPKHTEALFLRSQLLERQLKYDAAARDLSQLLEMFPNRLLWRRAFVQVHLNAQEFRKASELLFSYLEEPSLGERERKRLQYDLLMCLCLTKAYDRASSVLEGWLGAEPEDLSYKDWFVSVARLSGDPERAVQAAEKWFTEKPPFERSDLRPILLHAYWSAERFADAETLLLDWLEIDPDDVDLTIGLIQTLEQGGKADQALELARACRSDSRFRAQEAYDMMIFNLHLAARRYEDVVRLIRREISTLSENERIPTILRIRLCRTLINAEAYDEAERELLAWDQEARMRETHARSRQEEAEARAEQVEIARLMNLCYQAAGKSSLAVQQLERLYEINPNDPGTNNDLGYTWSTANQNLDQAESMVRFAVGQDPLNAAFLDSLGWVLYKKGDFEQAYAWLQKAARAPSGGYRWAEWLGSTNHPTGGDDAVIQDHLGDAAWRLNKADEALTHWQHAERAAREDEDQLQTPEHRAILEEVPQKIKAANEGQQPKVAAARIDP